MRLAAVLFDMDGTLVTSDGAVERAWMTWAGEYGVDGARAVERAHGRPSEPTIRTMRPDLDEAGIRVAADRLLELECTDLDGVAAAPGAFEVLDVVARRGLPWAVVTSAGTALATARLTAAGITPPVLVPIDDVPHGKPDPAGYLRAAQLLGVSPADCLVVEDADVGVAAGRAAGATTAALRGLDADIRLESLHDLAVLLSPEGRPGSPR